MENKCDRNGCENINCIRHSNILGYICDECYEEMIHTASIATFFMAHDKQQCKKNWELLKLKLYHFESLFPEV